jgi:hypothetical protein
MIIGISGKIGAGKDTVGKIIQILTSSPHFTNTAVKDFLDREIISPKYLNKKFADKLKDIVCILIGCTREQLEDREFKEKELGEEWWYYKTPSKSLIAYLDNNQPDFIKKYELIKLTPRLLLQLLGTECGRNIIHPNIWVNTLFADYTKTYIGNKGNAESDHPKLRKLGIKQILPTYPNWVITDVRFENEYNSVKRRGGLMIKVERPIKQYDRTCLDCSKGFDFEEMSENRSSPCCNNHNYAGVLYEQSNHASETGLDHITDWDYVIENDGSIGDLVEKIRLLMYKLKLL